MELTNSLKRQTAQAAAAGKSRAARGLVVAYSLAAAPNPHDHDHESVTRTGIAKRLAALKGYDFVGEYDPAARYPTSVYFVPSHTIIGLDTARKLGIEDEHDLFGGVVPHAFVSTKSITHPLFDPAAEAPSGWSHDFCDAVSDAVLPGYTAFTTRDARRAGRKLLERGAVRVKPALAIGGRGQTVARDAAALDAAIDAVDAGELRLCGVALEQSLSEVVTYSVGRVSVGAWEATYFGTQKLTADHDGAQVYGGSDLVVARGDFDALLTLAVPTDAQLAIARARTYDAAAGACFPGLIASRRNYDVVLGLDESGERRCGVLEQSWRIGGASGPEVAALEAFRDDPGLMAVRASCVEIYGDAEAPPGATVYFDGIDEKVGRLVKYTVTGAHVDEG